MTGRRQLTIAAAVAAGLTIIFFLFVLSPELSNISKVHTEAKAEQDKADTLLAKKMHLEDVRRNATELNARLAAVSGYLPSTPDLPDFIRLVQGAASLANVDLTSIAPSPPTKLGDATGVDEISVTLVVGGPFHPLEDFLSRLEQLRRIVLVQSLSLSPSIDAVTGATTLQSTIALKMYVVRPNARVGIPPATSPSPSPSP